MVHRITNKNFTAVISELGAEYVCIEPWYGYDDSTDTPYDISRKSSMLCLEADAYFNTGYLINIV